MDQKTESLFYFNGYKVQKLIFNINSNCTAKNHKINFGIQDHYSCTLEDNTYLGTIKLDITVFKDAKKNNYPFEIHFVLLGKFSAHTDAFIEKDFEHMMRVNGVAILFPYVRSIIADITKAVNVQPLLLPSMNIVNLLKANAHPKIDENMLKGKDVVSDLEK